MDEYFLFWSNQMDDIVSWSTAANLELENRYTEAIVHIRIWIRVLYWWSFGLNSYTLYVLGLVSTYFDCAPAQNSLLYDTLGYIEGSRWNLFARNSYTQKIQTKLIEPGRLYTSYCPYFNQDGGYIQGLVNPHVVARIRLLI